MLNTIDAAAKCPIVTAAPAAAELEAIKARQRATWASGDYGFIGTTLQIVGELLCEAVDLRAGLKVLDVAAGNGNCSLAAARRWCEVTSTDYVPSLLEDGRRRAAGDRCAHLVRAHAARLRPVVTRGCPPPRRGRPVPDQVPGGRRRGTPTRGRIVR